MREVTAKSMKLGRDLDGMLSEALERDLLVRIGWGRGGDEKPKKGEIGAISYLPPKSRVLLLGDLGECAGVMNNGGTFTLQGSSTSMLGAFQRNGRIVVEKDVGDRLGRRMTGGFITVQGSAGDEVGACMSGGTVIVRGHAGKRALGLTLEEDALVLVPSDSSLGATKMPDSSIAEGFESIVLVPSTSDRLPEHSPLDPYTLLMPLGSKEGGLLFPIPWLIESDSANTWQGAASTQPALVRTSPRECDLILVGESNLVDCADWLGNCAGIVLDLADMPPLNDAEIESILVSITCKMGDESMILLRDRVDRVDHLFRLVVDLDLDGAIIDAAAPGGSRAASALPRIGLAARAMNLIEQGRHLLIEMDEAPSAEDMLIAVAAGCPILVAPPPEDGLEETLVWLDSAVRGWMHELGLDGLEKLSRRNLRALDYDTASISGLRLIGYDRPLPMWLGN